MSRKTLMTQALFSILLTVIFLAGSGCDAIYRLLQKEGAQEKELLGEVLPFVANPNVLEIQKLLKQYGYKVGRPDGILGANTRKAIAAFQIDNGLKVSRFVDYATWDRLYVFEGYGLVVNGELVVAKLQEGLNAAGFDAGNPDGKLGKKTELAVKAFQEAEGLVPDGKVGYRTLWALADHLPFLEEDKAMKNKPDKGSGEEWEE